MKISFQNKKLEKLVSDRTKLLKEFGLIRTKILLKRLELMSKVKNLEDVRHAPGNFHELSADRKGQWACDLDQPYRLIFEPHEKPIPTDPDGSYIWLEIKAVEIVEVTNYHGK